MIDAQAHQELATRNSQAAVKTANATRNELLDRISRLEGVVAVLGQRLGDLEQKYNLLLTKNFNGGSTSD